MYELKSSQHKKLNNRNKAMKKLVIGSVVIAKAAGVFFGVKEYNTDSSVYVKVFNNRFGGIFGCQDEGSSTSN
jgi:hypothetical protein